MLNAGGLLSRSVLSVDWTVDMYPNTRLIIYLGGGESGVGIQARDTEVVVSAVMLRRVGVRCSPAKQLAVEGSHKLIRDSTPCFHLASCLIDLRVCRRGPHARPLA